MVSKNSPNAKNYKLKMIEQMYGQLPAFTDVFTEETFYITVVCFVLGTFVMAFILSRFITIRPVAD
ncbi:uncharacterized protein LOC123298254 [Chrysoperla carnea]|uniref:uncharacterized protein LOC123298254 n=1 Tax=Chrysoperla carnea TaxID=189513 RepID=UPI001D094482|nr:uncharacterized protein LOC123298254 [Chrysoperla carnea]